MKILAANKMDWNHPSAGGVEKNLEKTLKRLSNRGHEIHLFTSKYPESDNFEIDEGVKIHRFGLPKRTNEIIVLTIGQIYFNYLALKENPDIIYTINSIIGWISIRKPQVVGIHHIYGKKILKQFSFPLNIISYFIEKISILSSYNKKIFTVSESTKRRLIDNHIDEKNIFIVRNGVDGRKFEPGSNSSKSKILYMGRFEYNKGIDFLPKIYEKINSNYEGFELEIAGFGRKKALIKEFAEDKGNVRFHGFVNEKEKINLLKKSWVVLTPSRLEGWGTIIDEANASGTPAVGFDVDGIKDNINHGENGLLTNLDNEEESIERFAKKVIKILENDNLRKRLEKKSLESVKNRTWDKTTDKIEKLFENFQDEK